VTRRSRGCFGPRVTAWVRRASQPSRLAVRIERQHPAAPSWYLDRSGARPQSARLARVPANARGCPSVHQPYNSNPPAGPEFPNPKTATPHNFLWRSSARRANPSYFSAIFCIVARATGSVIPSATARASLASARHRAAFSLSDGTGTAPLKHCYAWYNAERALPAPMRAQICAMQQSALALPGSALDTEYLRVAVAPRPAAGFPAPMGRLSAPAPRRFLTPLRATPPALGRSPLRAVWAGRIGSVEPRFSSAPLLAARR
jgi:hypothetical protein